MNSYENLMNDIINKWDKSIFLNGGDISNTEYTNIYQSLGYDSYKDFLTDDFFEEFNSFNHSANKASFLNGMSGLNEDDKELLLYQASILFNTIDIKDKLLPRYMLKLALLLDRYRQSHNKQDFNKVITNNIQKKYLKKTTDDKTKIFKERVDDLIELMGGRITFCEDTQNFKQSLHEAYNNPSLYVFDTSKETISLPKQDIKDFLFSLKLKDKSQCIKDFITYIK